MIPFASPMLMQSAAVAASPPVFQSVSPSATPSANNITPNYPASIAAGDYLLGVVLANGNASVAYSPPAGFSSAIETHQYPASGNILTFNFFEKIAAGTESGAATFTNTGGIVNNSVAAILRFTGASGAEGFATADYASGSAAIVSPAVTTLGANRLLLNFYACLKSFLPVTPGAGYTQAIAFQRNDAGANDYMLVMDYKTAATAGAQATETVTPTSLLSSFTVVSFALKP